jgi:hypothetical protein
LWVERHSKATENTYWSIFFWQPKYLSGYHLLQNAFNSRSEYSTRLFDCQTLPVVDLHLVLALSAHHIAQYYWWDNIMSVSEYMTSWLSVVEQNPHSVHCHSGICS